MDLKSKDTTENNILIAKFMGREIHTDGIGYFDENFTSLKYNDWNTLMPVVEKIRNVTSYDRDKFSTEVTIYGDKTSIKSKGYGEKEHSKSFFNKSFRGKYNSIEPTYKAIVEYVKWYNK